LADFRALIRKALITRTMQIRLNALWQSWDSLKVEVQRLYDEAVIVRSPRTVPYDSCRTVVVLVRQDALTTVMTIGNW